MRYIIPDYFVCQQKTSEKLAIDDVTFVAFNDYQNSDEHEICLKTNLLAFVLQGQKQIRDLNQTWTFSAGQGLFLRQSHYVMSNICPAPGEAFQNFVFLIGDAYLTGFVERHGSTFKTQPARPLEDIHRFALTPLLRASIDSIVPYFQHPSKHTPALLQIKLDEILMQVLLADASGHIWSALQDASRRLPEQDLKSFMEKNYTKTWDLETFAARSNRSLSKFKKDFQAAFEQESPKRWINRKRLERAALMMQTTDRAITEIGYLTGFENFSYFIQLFKKTYAATPKQWQLNQKQQKKTRVR